MRTRRRFLAGSLLIYLGWVAAGCQPQTESSQSAGPTGTRTPVSLRLAFFPNVTHAAALVGTGTGRFKEELAGVATVEERVFPAGPAEIEALFAGEVDLGYIGPGPALNGYLKSRGDALRIVAGAASGGAALVARPDAGINSIADLAGKRVAVPQTGGTQDISLRHFLKTANLPTRDKASDDPRAVDVVQYAPADTLTQFQRKTIEAAWVPEPWVARLEQEAGAKVVLDETTLWPGKRFSTAVVVARKDFLDKHPEIVEKFLTAHVRVIERIQKEPEAMREVIGARLKELNNGKAIAPAVLKAALERTEITADPLPESVLTFADWSKELGYQRQDRTALTELFAEEPLQAAQKSAGLVPTGTPPVQEASFGKETSLNNGLKDR